jgi:transaldolase
MIGRTDDYLKNVVKASDMCIPAEALDLAGVAVMKNAYKVYKEKGFRTTLLTAAYRNYHHYVDFLGGDIIFTITSDWQRKFANCDWMKIENNMDKPVDEFYLNCLKQIPEFIQAYEPDGLKPEEFQHYGAFLATMKQFLGGYDSLVQLIRSYMIV